MILDSEEDNAAEWLNRLWGSTEQQLLAEIRSTKMRRIDRADYGARYADYIVDDLPIGPYKYELVFQMNCSDDRLSRVVMRHNLPLGESQDQVVRSAFNTLTDAFGAPEMLEDPGQFQWISSSTTIQLHTFDLPNSLNLVSIVFVPTGTQV